MSTSDQLKDVMFDAVSESIENMAFMEVTHGDNPPEEDLMWVSMSIEDPIKDTLYLGVPEPLMKELTAGVFAMDEDELEEQLIKDTLAELLNTLGGVFYTKALPESQTYQLGLPVHGEGEFPISGDQAYCWYMQLEDTTIVIAANGDGLKNL